jgi:hypothetical protein
MGVGLLRYKSVVRTERDRILAVKPGILWQRWSAAALTHFGT